MLPMQMFKNDVLIEMEKVLIMQNKFPSSYLNFVSLHVEEEALASDPHPEFVPHLTRAADSHL